MIESRSLINNIILLVIKKEKIYFTVTKTWYSVNVIYSHEVKYEFIDKALCFGLKSHMRTALKFVFKLPRCASLFIKAVC